MTNGHNKHAGIGLVGPDGKPLITDIRATRVKLVVLAAQDLGRFLSLDGKRTFKVNGWPEGAEVVGISPPLQDPANPGVLALGVVVHHPSFMAIAPGAMPPVLQLHFEELSLELAPDAEVVEADDLTAAIEDSIESAKRFTEGETFAP